MLNDKKVWLLTGLIIFVFLFSLELFWPSPGEKKRESDKTVGIEYLSPGSPSKKAVKAAEKKRRPPFSHQLLSNEEMGEAKADRKMENKKADPAGEIEAGLNKKEKNLSPLKLKQAYVRTRQKKDLKRNRDKTAGELKKKKERKKISKFASVPTKQRGGDTLKLSKSSPAPVMGRDRRDYSSKSPDSYHPEQGISYAYSNSDPADLLIHNDNSSLDSDLDSDSAPDSEEKEPGEEAENTIPEPRPNPISMEIWGEIWDYSPLAEKRSWVLAYNQNLILCGKAPVKENGEYMLHLYADDDITPEQDGMRDGDDIIFWMICPSGKKRVIPIEPHKAIFDRSQKYDLKKIDLELES